MISSVIGMAFLTRLDVGSSALFIAALFLGLLALPTSWFWFWFLPLAALYVRFQYVLMQHENRWLVHGWQRAARRDGGESGIGVADRPEQIAVAGEQADAIGEPRRIARSEQFGNLP